MSPDGSAVKLPVSTVYAALGDMLKGLSATEQRQLVTLLARVETSALDAATE